MSSLWIELPRKATERSEAVPREAVPSKSTACKASFRTTAEPCGHTVWLVQGSGPEYVCTHGSAETARACAFALARKGGCGSQPVCHNCTKVLPEELSVAIEVHSRGGSLIPELGEAPL
jgi:hypothetical protein